MCRYIGLRCNASVGVLWNMKVYGLRCNASVGVLWNMYYMITMQSKCRSVITSNVRFGIE